MKAPFLIGRAMLGGFFIYNGIHHLHETEMIAGYARSKKLPLAKAAVIGTGVAMIAGGASLVTGVKPKWGSMALIGFLGTVSATVHDFWNATDPQQKQNDVINFSKNLALAGATLALAGVDEPWEASVPLGRSSRTERASRLGRKLKKFGERKAKRFGDWMAA
ncbi:MAG TPA: DoxX family protein [Terriglobales bacterium]|nr:DoxX family protein [Terriglobales bacterium]